MSKCRSCGAEISWIRTATGKSIPVEGDCVMVVGDKSGNVTVVTDKGQVVTGYKVGDAYEGESVFGRASHFATCSAAKDFRQR